MKPVRVRRHERRSIVGPEDYKYVRGFSVARRGDLIYVKEPWAEGCFDPEPEVCTERDVRSKLPEFNERISRLFGGTVVTSEVRRDGPQWESLTILLRRKR
jgi:hypothetical protein